MEIKDSTKTEKMQSSKDVANIFRAILQTESDLEQDKEHFWVMGLNSKNVIKYIDLVSLGSLTSSIVHPRETYRMACMKGVASIVTTHNHPSGDPTPSLDDIAITKKLKDAGDILGIKLIDHVIVGDKTHFSFTEQKML